MLVGLTPSDRDLIERAVPDHLANQTRLTAGLTAEEVANLSALLKKLLRHAQAK